MISTLLALALGAVPIDIQVDGCVDAPVDEVRRIAAIELRDGATAGSAPVRAQLGCRDGVVEVSVDDPVTRKRLSRMIDLGPIAPKARGRYLALAVAELVTASWMELLLPPPRAAPAGAPISLAQTQAVAVALAALPVWRLRLQAHLSGRAFQSTSLLQAGGELGAVYLARGRWGAGLWIGAERGELRRPEGKIAVDTVSGALLASTGLEWEPVGLLVGAGLRAGGARVVGTPAEPERVSGASVAGAWAGPCARAELTLRQGRWSGAVGVEAGWSLLSVRGRVDGTGGGGAEGMWAGLTGGVEFRP